MKALILAAGLGTRLLPYSALTPKALFTLAGRPLLDIHIRNLRAAGCEAILINTHHLHERIEAFVAAGAWGIPVETRYEPVILGTGGAIRNAADFWDERPFMVVNADIHTTVNLAEVYAFHLAHRPAASLVLCDDPEFNSVGVDAQGRIEEFSGTAGRPALRRLTFTGIQVLDPGVLEFIPAGAASSSIDAYRRMIAAGRDVRACIPQAGCWKDLGTPQRYCETAGRVSAREAFRRAFGGEPAAPLACEPLAGDGSDRRWVRWRSSGRSLVMADHGLRAGQGVQEMDSFVAIGMHLKRRGQPVPAIHLADPVAGLVFLEDLGDRTLQQAAAQGTARRNVQALYRRVVEALVAMSIEGLDGFDPAWCYQTPAYSRELILERECAYFEEHFLRGTAGLAVDSRALRGEFEALADLALKHAEPGFMHRDMQSRNVMLKDGRPVFIDFQGARIGPVQYDLASLLADPYVGLGPDAQERLLQHAFERLCERRALSADAFFDCYVHCALCRNLQILGAFGFLSRVKNKRGFTAYIPRALAGLEQRLAGRAGESFPTLRHVVGRARRRLRL